MTAAAARSPVEEVVDGQLGLPEGSRADPVTGEPVKHGDARPLARNLSALASGQVVTWTMTLLWTVFVPRALGPGGYGIIVSGLSVSGVLCLVLGLGSPSYLVREIVLDMESAPKLVGTAIVLRLFLVPIVGTAAVVFAHVAHYGHDARVVLYLATAMNVLIFLAQPMQAGFQAIERMQYIAYIDVINKTAQSLIGIALVAVGFRAIGVAANMAVIAGIVVLLNAIWLRRFFKVNLRTNLRWLGRVAKHSAVYFTTSVFGMIYFWIDTIMLSLMTHARVVGWYGASTALFQTLMFLPVLVSTAWLPRFVRAFGESNEQLVRTARGPLEFMLVMSVPIAAGVALIAHPLIDTVYGANFRHAGDVMFVLAFCVPPIYMNIMLAQVSIAQKRQKLWTWMMIGSAIFNPLVNLVLIPWSQHRYGNGAIGAGIALVLTELLMDIVGFAIVGRQVLDGRSARRCALAILASAGMWGVAYAARPLGTPPSIALGVATLVVLIFALRIPTADELLLLRSGLDRLRRTRPALGRS